MSVVMLTDEQRHAVARRAEPLLLSAAAGSGKTSVLVERFVAAVREDAIAPANILAITFTERAAGELRSRVRARLLDAGDREAARDTEAAFIGTFHGFCARVLRAHPLAVGLDPAFAILDEGFAGRLRELAFTLALRDFLADERSEAVDMLAAYSIDRARAMIEQLYAELRSRGQRLPRLPRPREEQRDGEERERGERDGAAVRVCALLDELLRGFGGAYEQLKRDRGAVDFDDLELLTGELLAEREDLRRAWRERFELLMVDEFQDTNPRQLKILATLERGNLFTVGDELQSIYGFRHADVSLFRERREQLEELGGSLRLTRNFRSRDALLHVVNAVFAERFSDYSPLVPGRDEGEPESTPATLAVAHGARRGQPSPPVELLLTDIRGWEESEDLAASIAAGLPHAQAWRQAEARMLAQRVAELVEEGSVRAGDVVVLLRAVGDLEVFERALELQGLRTLAAVGVFWAHQQVSDLLAWLRALANPLDEQALYGALASPLGGCSLDCLALLASAARERRQGIWQTALAALDDDALGLADADRQALAKFCGLLGDEREHSSRRTLSELIERVIHATGYREHVLELDWGERRLANVHKLLRLARRFEASEGRDLRGFLDHTEYLKQASQAEPDAPVASSSQGRGAEPDAVRLMTIHAAKGLEFPVVCLADLGRQPNTQTPDLLVDAQRVGLRLVGLDGAGSVPALDYESLSGERRLREAEEEDRILYVAMTRARERLLLSGAVDFARWPTPRQGATPISWLAPALSAELPSLAQAAAPPVLDLAVGGAGDGARDDAGDPVVVRCYLNTPATVGDVLRLLEPEASGGASWGASEGAGEQLSFFVDGAPSSIRNEPERVVVDTIAIAASKAGGSPAPAGGEEPLAAGPLSYTSLSELERCGYRYYLERVLGLPEQPAPRPTTTSAAHAGLEPRARGTLIHRLMELDFGRDAPITAEEVGDVADRLALRVSRDERAEIAALIEAAREAAPAARVAAAKSVRREHPFAFSPFGDDAAGDRGPLITGVIDLLAVEGDGTCLIVDYKSDRVTPDADLEAIVREHYGAQRELYALALLRAGAERVEVVHWFLERPHEWIGAGYRAHDRHALEGRLAGRLERAGERPYAVSPRPHRGLCLTCPGRSGLCSWGDAETLREIPGADLF
jgi:ATP-dependent exoDNAse (exonuclease V) beta subunit